ncbi:MAG: N-acetyltransferase family protein [Ferroplasma sp.]|uniref:GNAT family N-acetyltransferase n=1 Tax=Ferroplasma sp. TaxID=2591003 RepID=UPI0028162F4E|nr:N-acetyltransferase family protein [Ferroplasma sp.]WMT52038.1 MAG: N-acetyltransferase family protein [Ferroplasma sp.]
MDVARICRIANLSDAGIVAEIWNQGIADSNATLETKPRDDEFVRKWLLNREERYPVMVVELYGKVSGWLSFNPFSQREAYKFVVDISIYVKRDMRGTGTGTFLLDQGIITAVNNGFHKMVLTMIHGNEIAKKLYLSRGFSSVGILHEQGIINGKWVDTEIMEKIL